MKPKEDREGCKADISVEEMHVDCSFLLPCFGNTKRGEEKSWETSMGDMRMIIADSACIPQYENLPLLVEVYKTQPFISSLDTYLCMKYDSRLA